MKYITARWVGLWAVVVSLALLLALFSNLPLIGRVVFLLTSATIIVLLILRRSVVPHHPPKSSTSAQAALALRIESVRDRAKELKFTDDQLGLLNYLLVYPSSTRSRVNESIDLRQDRIYKTGKISYQLPNDPDVLSGERDVPSGELLVPVVRPVKGQQVIGLIVKDHAAADVPTWSHEESLPILLKLLELVLKKACHTRKGRSLNKDQLEVLTLAAEIMLRAPQPEIGRTSQRHLERSVAIDQLRKYAEKKQLKVVNWARYQEFTSLVGLLSSNYVILARLAPAERFMLSYSYALPAREHANLVATHGLAAWWASTRSLVRKVSQTEASRVRVSVNKGNSCASYHLDIRVPYKAHVGAIRLLDEDGKLIQKRPFGSHDFAEGYFRVSGKGTDTAHLYTRKLVSCCNYADWDGKKVPRPPAHLEIATVETPPGALGRALIVSFLVLLLTYITGYRAQAISDLNIDSLALFGGVIAASLVILGFVRGPETAGVRVIALLALGSAAISALVMLCSAALITTRLGMTEALTFGALEISFGGIEDWPWIICCAIAVLNVVGTASALIVRLLRLQNLGRRTTASADPDAVHS